MNAHFLRGQLLLRQERYDQAIAEFQQALAKEPDDAFYMAFLANALLRKGSWQEALRTAQDALAKDSTSGYCHWTLSLVWLERNHHAEAEASIRQAIELQPEDADNHGLLARILHERDKNADALAAAATGLALDPKNDLCLTFRSRALMALGRLDEARWDADSLLADAPDDAWNHCLRGDQLVLEGRSAEARQHYLEALRVDPGNSGARHGLVTTLKARSPIYSLLLKLLLAMERFRGWSVWLIVILLVAGLRVGDAWTKGHPEWIVAYEIGKILFWSAAILATIANPLFDLLLRFDRDGKHALSEDEKRATNWYLVCFLFAGLCGTWSFFGKSALLPRTLGVTALFFTQAVGEVFASTPGYVRRRMAGFTIAAAAVLVLSPFLFVGVVVWILVTKRTEFLKPAIQLVIWIPIAVLLFSVFAENLRQWLEKRRPDNA
jgi:tetratricopeptide (TPR) repeat protein